MVGKWDLSARRCTRIYRSCVFVDPKCSVADAVLNRPMKNAEVRHEMHLGWCDESEKS